MKDFWGSSCIYPRENLTLGSDGQPHVVRANQCSDALILAFSQVFPTGDNLGMRLRLCLGWYVFPLWGINLG